LPGRLDSGKYACAMLTCASCGTESPETFRFCPTCASRLQLEATEAHEERKVVSVLFADLVGFTSRSERIDPEDVRAVLEPFHAHVRSELERYGGTVEKYIGDAVMAVFGAPTAHEDDPERAVRAALAIRDWAAEQPDVDVRIGINTGETIVDVAARPERGESMVAGDIVNTASRLQGAAPVNGIIVGEQTHRATRDAIDYGERGDIAVKGKALTVPAWIVVEARSRYGADVATTSATELVGREADVRMLIEALARVRRDRSVQLVTLVGVPGIGKSRLVYELFRSVEQEPDLITWRQGRCLPYGEGLSYWALGEVIKAQAGILESDDDEQVRARLHTAVATVVEEHAEWVESHLGPLVGLVPESELAGDRRNEAFAAWRQFLEGVAERHPLVLVFEDLQWADAGFLDFVEHLVDWVTDVPLLVVATTRPELLTERPGWGGGMANAATISLSTLSDEETAHIIASILDRSGAAPELRAAALAKAAGNPLYAEEFAKLLGESGAMDDAAMPAGVQGIIAARLDLLGTDAKRVLQAASVLGKVFWTGAVAEMSGRNRWQVEGELHDLERRELVRRDRRSSVAGETELSFRHLLVRDVAYGQIPRALRAELHAAAARWIEGLGRPDDHAEMLAYHYTRALELARATGREAGELTAPARQALRVAAERALALNAFAAAADLFDEALALSPDDDPGRARLLLGSGTALLHAGSDRAATVLEEAQAALVDVDDLDRAALADALLARLWWFRGQRDRSDVYLHRASELVADRLPSPEKATVLGFVASRAQLAGDDGAAIRVGQDVVEMALDLDLPELRIEALTTLGTARGRYDPAAGIAELELAQGLAMERNSPELSRIYNNLAFTQLINGDARAHAQLRESAHETAKRFGDEPFIRFSRGVLPSSDYLRGQWDECLAGADAFLAECEAGSPHYLEFEVRMRRARIRLARGDDAGAASDSRVAMDTGRAAKDPQAVEGVLAAMVGIAFELGDVELAYASAVELLERLETRLTGRLDTIIELTWAAHALEIAERLLSVLGRLQPRGSLWLTACRQALEEDFAGAAATLERIGSMPDEARANLEASRRAAEAGRSSEAQRFRSLADDFHRSVGAVRYLEVSAGR
jgi:class 3 adenylate cyclase